jgi:hypothetical protein
LVRAVEATCLRLEFLDTLANLKGVDFEGANLEVAFADWLTTWPEGFDPKVAGAIFD